MYTLDCHWSNMRSNPFFSIDFEPFKGSSKFYTKTRAHAGYPFGSAGKVFDETLIAHSAMVNYAVPNEPPTSIGRA